MICYVKLHQVLVSYFTRFFNLPAHINRMKYELRVCLYLFWVGEKLIGVILHNMIFKRSIDGVTSWIGGNLGLKLFDMLAIYRIVAFKYCGICIYFASNGIFNLKNRGGKKKKISTHESLNHVELKEWWDLNQFKSTKMEWDTARFFAVLPQYRCL